MLEKITLIMCSSMPDALHYAREAAGRGERVIATSSLKYDEGAKDYEIWEWLPSVYEDGFLAALDDMITRHGITQVYCPNNIAYLTLLQLRDRGKFNLPLLGMPPIATQVQSQKRLIEEAIDTQEFIRHIAVNCPLPAFRIASILRQTELTFGESNPSKLAAMMAVFSHAPKGDVVEIGSYWGKTAVALTMMAQYFHTGAVLCVDPWDSQEGIQKDSPALMQSMPSVIDWETVFSGFIVHTAAVATKGQFNYIRSPSIQAETTYRRNPIIHSEQFGTVKYTGKIALIHIDGNHDYSAVKADFESWRPHVAPGGWIILDDYVWLHGDGPRKLGDEVMQREALQYSFTAGKALFLQLAD